MGDGRGAEDLEEVVREESGVMGKTDSFYVLETSWRHLETRWECRGGRRGGVARSVAEMEVVNLEIERTQSLHHRDPQLVDSTKLDL